MRGAKKGKKIKTGGKKKNHEERVGTTKGTNELYICV